MKNKYLAGILALSVGFGSLNVNADHQVSKIDDKALHAAIDKRSEKDKARDQYRNPAKTLAFFQIEPGMKVAEALPGGGWYSKILADYLGGKGALYGINYADDMWPRFGFFSEDRIKNFIARTTEFPGMISEFTDNGIATDGFTFATIPSTLNGTLDRVLFVRALHNLNRFEAEAGTASQALKASYDLLKPGGMVGVVQHRLDENAGAEGANGQRGYLKQSQVVEAFKSAGFELVATTEFNANPKDQPSESDVVWRLPPSLNGVKDNEQKKKAMLAIGESDRMTLLFKKPE